MLIKRNEIEKLSADIRRIIDGHDVDLRDNNEGVFPILKNDINTLAHLKNEQIDAIQRERDILRSRLEDISHQLKTPLTSTLIMADLLESAPPDKQAEFIANIRQSLTRMEWLVSTLLKIAKLDAGVVEFLPERVKAATLIEQALEPLQIQLDVKDQKVEISEKPRDVHNTPSFAQPSLGLSEQAEPLPFAGAPSAQTDSGQAAYNLTHRQYLDAPLGGIELYCDRRWTAEALTNVLKNASEYSPPGGRIVVEAGENPLCTWITIIDSGPGISNADIATIFRRFEGSRSAQGYGIGLPLALAIMRGQNGDIQIDGGGAGGSTAILSASSDGNSAVQGAAFTLKFFK